MPYFLLFSRTTLWVETNNFFNIIEDTKTLRGHLPSGYIAGNTAKQITPDGLVITVLYCTLYNVITVCLFYCSLKQDGLALTRILL